MKNSHIRLIIGLMAFSMLGLSFLQYQWIQETKATKQAQFDLTINDVMDKVAQKIEKLEAASMITKNFPKPKREYIEALVQHPDKDDEKEHKENHHSHNKHTSTHTHTHTHTTTTTTTSTENSGNTEINIDIRTKSDPQLSDPTHYTPKQEVYHPIIGLGLSLYKAQHSKYQTGLYVERVSQNGIAETAGIQKKDILLGINGNPVKNHLDLKMRVNQLSEEDDLFFTFARNGKVITSPSALESSKINDPNHKSNRLFLGVYCKDAPPTEDMLSLKGVFITDVISNSTADEAGLKKEDILMGIGDQSIKKVIDIKEALSHHTNGEKVAITFWRDEKKHISYAKLKATKEEDPNVNWKVSSAAVQIQTYIKELNKLDRSLLALDEMYKEGNKNSGGLGVHLSELDNLEGGAMINRIAKGGPADKAGLLKNDILTSVNGKPIGNIKDFHNALQNYVPNDEISIGFKRRSEEKSNTETTIITNQNQQIIINRSDKKTVETDEVETLAKLMNREDILWAHIEKQLNDVYSLIIEKWLVDIPLQERVRPQLLENTLGAFLEDAGIDIPYEYCLTSNDEVIYSKSLEKISCMQKPNIYRKKLFNDAVYSQPGELTLHFPEQDKYILRSSAMMLGSSILFNLIIIFTFAYTIHTILRQKKLSEMKTDFINNMTHELKTPISTIKLATEMLTDKGLPKTSNSIDRYANMIHEENERLESHVEKVLQYARIEKDTLKLNIVPVNMHNIIQEAIQKIGLQVSKRGGEIQCSLDALQSVVQGDQLHLTNVVSNLLDNANKYSEGAPNITVFTRTTPEGLAIAVKDNGIGMTKETIKRIFDKFYRVPTGNIHNVKGFGLGLSYVKSMVEAHGGTVTARSKMGKGSTIEFTLPVEAPQTKTSKS